MSRGRTARGAAAALALGGLACVALTGCEQVQQQAGEIVSSATGAVASAAQEKMNEVKDGVNAARDVRAGPTSTDGDRTVAEVTATNPDDKDADYTIWVNFRDDQGNLLDAVVVSVNGVGPGASKSGTARSNRSLSGATKAEIAQALRH
ncbi:FxLYD domain-containing protein [Streptomyces sp. NPDC012769]|uniref:FxLYD domain-containing protein n=1 Tax=Streptomyces sp. NPDC012769 TaxID=3364848 RepID=UPI0036CCE796